MLGWIMNRITNDAESVFILKSEKSLFNRLNRVQSMAQSTKIIIGPTANKISLIEYIRDELSPRLCEYVPNIY